MIKLSPSRILFVLPDIALASMATSFLVIMLTGSFYGLLEQYIIAIIYFLLAAIIVSGSTAILAGGAALFLTRHSRLHQLLIALLMGLLHGYLYSLVAHRVFALLLSTFNVPVSVPWMVGSSLGIAVGLTRSAVQTDTLLRVERSDIVIVSGFLALLASCGLISACLLTVIQLLAGGVTQHRVINPTGTITAFVIRDDCGATCGCEMRVDVQAPDQYVAEVYRSWTACDAQASWESATELHIVDDDGREQHIDVKALGLEP